MARLPQPGSDNGTWGDILNEYLSQTLKSDGSLRDNSVTNSAIAPHAVTAAEIASDTVTAAQIQDGTITEAQLDASVQNKLNTAGSGNVADGTITTAKLQDGAVTNVKVAPSAAIAQSKIANLTTDLAGKAASVHTHVAAEISDSTVIGRALVAAADAASARSVLGAGTSDLVLGTTSTTAKAGDYVPTKTDVGLANVDNTSDATKNSATATLTNKTLDGTNNTFQNIPQSAVTGLSTALSSKVAATTTVNGHALSSNITITPGDVLPTQSGNSGRFLTTDGSNVSWGVVAGGGDMMTSTYDPAGINQQLIGISAAQTLVNKTISGSNNTLSNISILSLSTTGTASASTYLRGDGVWSVLNNRVTTNNQTNTTYTLVLSDAGTVVELNNVAAITLTVPPNSSAAFTAGDVIELWQQGTGQVTVAPGAGVTIRSSGAKLKLSGQYSGAALRYRGADEWVLVGDLAP